MSATRTFGRRLVGAFCLLLMLSRVGASCPAQEQLGTVYKGQPRWASRFPDLYRHGYSLVSDRWKGVWPYNVTESRNVTRHMMHSEPVPLTMYKGTKITYCLYPKGGSTRWKTLLYYGQFREVAGPQHSFGRRSKRSFYSEGHNLPVDRLFAMSPHDVEEALADSSAWRVLFVRNPYKRTLSGFLDKTHFELGSGIPPPEVAVKFGLGNTTNYMGGPYKATPAEFKRFLKWLVDNRDNVPDPHFRLQSSGCWLPDGFEYDLILKVEEMTLWYEDLVVLFGLERHVEFGWNLEAQRFSKCFMPLGGRSCEATSAYLSGRAGGSACREASSQALPSWMTTKTSGHSRGTMRMSERFFADPETLLLATTYLLPDLEAFGYDVMQGPPEPVQPAGMDSL